jgi:hypothetical protein
VNSGPRLRRQQHECLPQREAAVFPMQPHATPARSSPPRTSDQILSASSHHPAPKSQMIQLIARALCGNADVSPDERLRIPTKMPVHGPPDNVTSTRSMKRQALGCSPRIHPPIRASPQFPETRCPGLGRFPRGFLTCRFRFRGCRGRVNVALWPLGSTHARRRQRTGRFALGWVGFMR